MARTKTSSAGSTRSTHKAKLSKHKMSLVASGEPADIKVALGEDGQPTGPPTFSGVAYSGGLVPGYTAKPPLPYPYVIDLESTKKARTVHANLDHKSNQRVGHVTDAPNDGKQLRVEGLLSAATPHRDEVAGGARDGQPWELSIEGSLGPKVLVPKGQTAVVNGRTLKGPFYRMTNNTLTDVAFVTHGADEANELVKVAASTAQETEMDPLEKFALSLGVDLESASDEQKANLEAMFEAQKKAAVNGNGKRKSFASLAKQEREENQRQEDIQHMALTSVRENPLYVDQIETMVDDAIESKMSVKDFEVALLRNLRSRAGRFETSVNRDVDARVIECALCMYAGLPKIEDKFPAQVLEAVDRNGMRNFGLQQLLITVASKNGYQCRPGERITDGNLRTILEFCFPPATARLAGQFSSISLPDILGNVANKELLAGYMEQDQTWREIATVKPVNNFHQVTSYRLMDDLEYEEVGPTGEIKHGTLAQESYTRQAKTYAKMLGLTRVDIINDDLGALDDLRTRLGAGAAKKFNNIFWARFMAAVATMFTTARGNYIEGATTNLGVDGVGLEQAITAYRKMKSPAADGAKRVGASGGRPTKLLVPPELEFIADRLYASAFVNTGGAATAESVPSANIHVNKYRPIVQDRLSDSAFTGFSATQYYLFGEFLKAMVVSFLFGKQTPTVESTDADFNTLGILFRGFHDFGADPAEYLSGVAVKGAA